jgi:hypothetical protein
MPVQVKLPADIEIISPGCRFRVYTGKWRPDHGVLQLQLPGGHFALGTATLAS